MSEARETGIEDRQPASTAAVEVDTRLPSDCWSPAVRYLEECDGHIYWVVVDADWSIRAASASFQRDVLLSRDEPATGFLSVLPPALAVDMRERESSGTLESGELELIHPVKGGSRSVAYRMFRLETGWLVVGRDQSRQIELVSQMSVLVEDLEVEVRRERDLAQRLRELLANDELTGLANRRRFREVLRSEWDGHVASGRQFAVISLDLDHFKAVNDRFGHAVGDDVLRRVARTLEAGVRAGDTVARHGGEEFVILASGVGTEGALVLAERVRGRIELAPMPPGVDRLTVSLGVAATDAASVENPRDLLARSDLALYAAKRNGRNRVELATDH